MGPGTQLWVRHAQRLLASRRAELAGHARATRADASAGESFPAFKALYEEKAKEGTAFESFTAEAFDSAFIAFLAALKAASSDPTAIAGEIVSVTTDPGEPYTFEQLDQAIQAILDGQDIHFIGATGPLNFDDSGRVSPFCA